MNKFNLKMNGNKYILMDPERVKEEIANGNAVVIALNNKKIAKNNTRNSEGR